MGSSKRLGELADAKAEIKDSFTEIIQESVKPPLSISRRENRKTMLMCSRLSVRRDDMFEVLEDAMADTKGRHDLDILHEQIRRLKATAKALKATLEIL